MTRNSTVGGIVELNSAWNVLGDFATIYLMVAMALCLVGMVGTVAHATSPLRARYAKMAVGAWAWPVVGGWYLIRP